MPQLRTDCPAPGLMTWNNMPDDRSLFLCHLVRPQKLFCELVPGDLVTVTLSKRASHFNARRVR